MSTSLFRPASVPIDVEMPTFSSYAGSLSICALSLLSVHGVATLTRTTSGQGRELWHAILPRRLHTGIELMAVDVGILFY